MNKSLSLGQFILTPFQVLKDTRLNKRHLVFLLAYFHLDEIQPNPGSVDFELMVEITGYTHDLVLQIWHELHQFGWVVTVERKDKLGKQAVIAIPNLDKLKE